MARRWRQDPGLPTDKWNVEQRGGWFYATPKPKPAKKKKLPPLEFMGDPTLRGSYKKAPALNPNDWVTQEGRDGRFYAVKRTELTGLDPDSRRLIRDFDTETTGQRARIQAAYDQQATDAEASAARDRQALADYARNTGVVVNPNDPTAVAVGRAMGASAAAAGGPEVVRGLDMPGVLRASGVSAAERYAAGRQGTRTEVLAGIRNAMAQADAERQRAAAELRSKNLDVLTRLAGYDSSTERALISSNTQLAGQEAANQRANLQAQTSIRNTDARIASSERQASARIENDRRKVAASLKAKGSSPATVRAWASHAQKMAQGIPFSYTDQRGKTVRDAYVYNYNEVVSWLLSAGATTAQARRIANNIPKLRETVVQPTGGTGPPAPRTG